VVERPTNDPRPPRWCYMTQRLPDGQGVPGERPPLPLATRQVVIAAACTVILIVALIIGILR
jgi:hypothetical protein